MILATLRDLAKTLGCRPDQADDVVRSEPSARAALSRRGLFQAAGAVAARVAFGEVVLDPLAGYTFRIGVYANMEAVYSQAIVDRRLSAMWVVTSTDGKRKTVKVV